MKKYYLNENKEINFNFIMWAIIGLIVITPIIQEFSKLSFLFKIGTTIIFLTGIYGLANSRKRMIAATILYIPMFLTTWSDFFPSIKHIKFIGNLAGFILILGLIYFIFRKIATARTVSLELIKAAITAYLLLGFAWTLPYLIIYFHNPNSFSNIDVGAGRQVFESFLYFSYVTLTTLGYGDMCPVSGIARSVALVEAIVGQLYLVIVISWMVGIKVGQDLKAE